MISTATLLQKSEKLFFKIATSVLQGEYPFPLTIPANKELSGLNYSDFKADLVPLHQQSKAVKGKGYSIDWKTKTVHGSKQQVPHKIYFETLEDYLFFIKRGSDFEQIIAVQKMVASALPSLTNWANINPSILLANIDKWAEVIGVCNYFATHQPPHPLYIRELPIAVHTKFIEDNKVLLKKLLDIVLPKGWVNSAESDFSARYFLKQPAIQTQLRILDESLKPLLGYHELALTLDDAAWLEWQPEKVFIIENKACYLTFPKVKNAVAIFGEGFKSRMSRHIPWLEKTDLYCWFDLDAAGFEMLNTIRQYYPSAKSFLMDETTYQNFSAFSVHSVYRKRSLDLLTEQEQAMYKFLVANDRRLEQERVTNEYVTRQVEYR
jgi:hypothetical protein